MSASFSISAKSASLPTPRPPETTIFAEVSSGRSEAATLSSTQDDRPVAVSPEIVSTAAAPVAATAPKVAVRTVKTLILSDDFTVWIALPA